MRLNNVLFLVLGLVMGAGLLSTYNYLVLPKSYAPLFKVGDCIRLEPWTEIHYIHDVGYENYRWVKLNDNKILFEVDSRYIDYNYHKVDCKSKD